MDNNQSQHELIRGRLYRYDADLDIWYPVPPAESAVSKWAWVIVGSVLAIFAYYIEFMH